MKKILATLSALALLVTGLAACSSSGGGGGTTTLNISYQDTAFPALIEASGVLKGASFNVKWANLTGPAANLQALYSGAIDLGHMGDTSLTIEQANAKTPWTKDNAPLEIVAGWRNDFDPKYTPLVTAVRTSAHIDTTADLKGHSWAYNFGGYNYAQYLMSVVKAGLSTSDVKGKEFADGATSAAAFNSGQVDVYSGAQASIISSLDSGDAKILLDDRDTNIPALNVWATTRKDLNDSGKTAALKDFFTRMSGFWSWYDAHPDQAKAIIEKQLKVDDTRAEFEYHVRSGQFWAFDSTLIKAEQNVAQALYDGKAISKLPDVSISFDGRFNQAQKAVDPLTKAGSS
jgi:sulfonate transport system substrate-binding protein